MLFDSLIGEQHVLLNLHFETRIAFDKECCFLQEIYKDDYTLCVQVFLRNRVRLRLVYSLLFERLVLPELFLVYLGKLPLPKRC